jgi:hypothetical protein
MSFDQHANFVFGIVKTAPTPANTGVSLVLEDDYITNFPDPVDGEYDCTICSPSVQYPTKSNSEIVRVTVKISGLITITRHQKLTTAISIQAGDIIFSGVYADHLKDIESALNSHQTNTSNPHSVTKTQVGLSNVTNDSQVKRSEMAVANGIATLGSDGKIPSSQLNPLAITSVFTASTQASQLALTAEEGDICVRTDLNKSFIHNTGVAGTMADWTELLTPTDAVVSVNGYTGAVSLTKSDISLGNVDNTSDTNKPVSTAQQSALDLKVDKVTGKGLSTNDFTTSEQTKLSGIETNANNYSLPTASATVLGGIKVGSRLSINSGVLSADVQTTDISGKEDLSNKVTSFSTPTDAQYPSAKLTYDQLATKSPTSHNHSGTYEPVLTKGNLSGTANQISVSGGTGAVIGSGVTLSLPQNIDSTAIPTFAGLVLPYIKPAANSTTAFQIRKADGTTSVLNVDTTNGNVGIGTTNPGYALDVVGSINASSQVNGVALNATSNYRFGGANILTTTSGVLKIGDISSNNLVMSLWTYNTERVRIDSSGNVGIGTTTPTNILSLGGNSVRKVWMERHSTANTAGNSLTLEAGGATVGATDKNGGDLIIKSGLATGTGYSSIKLQAPTAGSTGTADATFATLIELGNNKIGFFGVTVVARPTAMTAAGTYTLNTGDAGSDTEITLMRTRINELETKLKALGLLT